jgi:hypothetical protein
MLFLPAYGVTYACTALFRSESGTRGRLCLPLCILVLGSVIVTQVENLYVPGGQRLRTRRTTAGFAG